MSDRLCAGCSKPLVRRKGETAGNFARRKNCDRNCMGLAFRLEEPGDERPVEQRGSRVKDSLVIEIRDKRLRDTNGRLSVSAHTTSESVRDDRKASLRKIIERGDMDVIASLRAGKIHITEIDAAVREGDYQRLKQAVVAPCDTLGVAVRKTLRTVKATKEAGTLKVYTGMARALELKFAKSTSLDAITDEAAEAFLHGPQKKGKPWSARTQRQAVSLFQRIWVKGKASTQPWGKIELPRDRRVRVAFLAPAEWAALVARHTGLPEMAILALGALAGLRLGEIRHLRPDIDVDMTRRVIHIQPRTGEFAWKPKTDNSVRDVPMCDALHAFLEAHIADGYAGDRYMIHAPRHDRPMSARQASRKVQVACETVGIRWGQEGDGITTHSLRHTFASWLAQADVQLLKIAKLMGDTVESVTKYYAHLLSSDLSMAVRVIDGVAKTAEIV